MRRALAKAVLSQILICLHDAMCSRSILIDAADILNLKEWEKVVKSQGNVTLIFKFHTL